MTRFNFLTYRRIRSAALVSFLIAGGDAVLAVEAEDTTSTALPEVSVMAGKPYREIIPAQTLEGEELQRLNSHSIADAVRYFSGVQLKDYGGVGGVKTLDIRSMGTNHLGVFYDGIQLGNAQNGQIDLGKFSLDNIEEISLYNGQKSDIFQPAKDFGSAGTVYIRTRRPHFAEKRRFNLNATFRTGSFGLANPSLRAEYKISDNVSATVNAEYTYATGKYRFRYRKVFSDGTLAWDTTATRRNGDIHALRLESSIFGRIPKGDWQGKIYFYNSEKGIPGAIVNNVWKNSQRQWDRDLFAQGSFRKQLGDRYELLVNGKYSNDYMRYLNPDTTLMYLDNSFRQQEFYLSAANRVEILPNWDANLSVDWQYNTLSSNLVNFSYPTRNTLLAAAATAWRYRRFKAQGSVLGTFVFDRSRSGAATRKKNLNRFTEALFASWQPFDKQDFNIRAFYKSIFRMPTFNDLYYTDIGNADLRPENATQYDLGLVWNLTPGKTVWSSIRLSVDGYFNRVTDKIIAVPKGTGQYRWMMMNIGEVHITGLDATAAANLALPYQINLNGRVTYTYQSALDFSDPQDNLDKAGTYRSQIAYIPRHSGSAILGADWRMLRLNYSFIYVGERYSNSSNIPVNYVQPWYTHDLSLSAAIPINRSQLNITLEINNLFDQQYEVIMNYPMPGRNFKLILQFDL